MYANKPSINYNDFKHICRTCTLNQNLKPIQDNILIEILCKITDIHYEKNDELPQQICETCIQKLIDIQSFILKCTEIDSNLKQYLNDYKNDVYVKTEIDETPTKLNFDTNVTNIIVTPDYLPMNTEPEPILNDKKKQHKCETCNKIFKYVSHLKDHERIHTGERPFTCDVCAKTFKQSSDLIKHKRIHSGERPYQCDVCLKTFKQSSDMIKHKRIHGAEQRYVCEMCPKTFTQLNGLLTHKRLHTCTERPYTCKMCPKTFKQVGELVKHERIHNGERPFECDVCLKTFVRSHHLIRHKIIHSGERPYQCDVCAKSFNNQSNLMKHKNNIHKE